MKRLLSSAWFILGFRLVLGGIFLASAIGKLQHPGLFVDTVVGYNLLPEALARIYGTVLPWAEAVLGVSLILGVFSALFAALSMALTASFAIAAIYTFWHPTDLPICGCFGELVTLSHSQSLVLDAAMVAMGAIIILGGRHADQIGLLGVLKGRLGKVPAAVPGLALAGLLALGLGLTMNSVGHEPASGPLNGEVRLMYFWNGCPECYGAEVDQLLSLEPDYGSEVDFVSVDYSVNENGATLQTYGVNDYGFTVLLLSCAGESDCSEQSRFEGSLHSGTFDLPAIKSRLDGLLAARAG